jgi:MFS family permease
VLTSFYGVDATKVPIYGLAFSVGNLAGPLLLAPLFDSVGRKKMISGTYLVSGVLLAVSALLFDNNDLTATSRPSCGWSSSSSPRRGPARRT